jgi:peptidoglycan/LPS O-acetylase OafA/YrhL
VRVFLLLYGAQINVHSNRPVQPSPKGDTDFEPILADADEGFLATFASKYFSVFSQRVFRIWPSLASAVFFVGFIWGEYVNDNNVSLDHGVLDECKRRWWTNMFFIANFWKTPCYGLSWAVSILFQLSFLAPLPAYLYAAGKKGHAFAVVYAFIFLGLVSRGLTVFLFRIDRDPISMYAVANEFWLQRMPWCRAAEFSIGILSCFSAAEAEASKEGKEKRAEEESGVVEESSPLVAGDGGEAGSEGEKRGVPTPYYDIYYLVGEPMREWLQSPTLLLVAFVQTATLAVGFMFVYEGTLQYHEMNLNMTSIGKGVVLIAGDTIVASLFALLLRWATSNEHGGWLKAFLSWPIWYPLSSLSYNAFLYAWPAVFWANSVIVKETKTGYSYFSKAYFLGITFALCIAFGVSVFIEVR